MVVNIFINTYSELIDNLNTVTLNAPVTIATGAFLFYLNKQA